MSPVSRGMFFNLAIALFGAYFLMGCASSPGGAPEVGVNKDGAGLYFVTVDWPNEVALNGLDWVRMSLRVDTTGLDGHFHLGLDGLYCRLERFKGSRLCPAD